jgi:predicted amidohydrolase
MAFVFSKASRLADEGADYLVSVASWPKIWGGDFASDPKRSAVQAKCWVIVSNALGSASALKSYGYSRVIDPSGDVISDTGSEEGMVVAVMDLVIKEQ